MLSVAAIGALTMMQVQPVPGDPLAAPQGIERQARTATPAASTAPLGGPTARLRSCLALSQTDAAAAYLSAREWQVNAKGNARAEAGHCLGLSLLVQGRWEESRDAFADALTHAAPSDHAYRARLGGLAGNTAFGIGDFAGAAALLGAARGEALAGALVEMGFALALDQAEAQMAAGDNALAGALLADTRDRDPNNARAWLLSASHARKTGELDKAARYLSQAERLAPGNPETGLEAGLLALASGNSAAARVHLQAVITAAPGGPLAAIAEQQLSDLGPEAKPVSQ